MKILDDQSALSTFSLEGILFFFVIRDLLREVVLIKQLKK